MNLRLAPGLTLAICALAAPAQARELAIDSPAGSVEDVVIVIARQSGTSVVVTDRTLATRRVGAVRGRYSVREALEIVARAAGARLVATGHGSWRLVPAPPQQAKRIRPARSRPAPEPRPAPPPEAVAEEMIVVVGSKREMPLRDYPGQVSQLDGKEIEFGGVGGTDRIAARVASISTTHLGSGRNKLFIRGVADSSFTGPTQSTVGQYFGDLRLSYNAPDPDLRLSDLASVEVLEGPQGTLYGAGALGGIVRIVPNTPRLGETSGRGMAGTSVTAHGKPSHDASLVFNLPLSEDRLGLRLALDAERQGGYIDKPLLQRDDVNRTSIVSGRGTLRYDAGGGWTVDLIGVSQLTEGNDSQYADRDGDHLTRSSAVREGYRASYIQGQVVVDGMLGRVRFRSTSGIVWHHLRERYDATLPDSPPRLFEQRNHTRMIANETRAWAPLDDGFGWVLGTSLTHNRTNLRRELGLPGELETSTGVTNSISEYTLYGEASVRLSRALVATGGGRLTWSKLGGSGQDVPFELAIAGQAITAERTESMVLPSAAITAQPLAHLSIYLRYQEGFRPGGLAISGPFVRRFRNDHTATYEVGFRLGRPGRGRFDLAASASHTDWRNIQADFIDAYGLPTTANVGDGRIWTVSASTGFSPTDDLRFDGGIVYNDSSITQPNLYALLASPVSRGPITEIPNVAKLSARFGFDYRHAVNAGAELRINGWARYIGKSRLGVGPELGEIQGNYLESQLSARLGNEGMGATLSVSNLSDTAGNRFALGTPFAVGREQITPLRPLTVRLGLDASF